MTTERRSLIFSSRMPAASIVPGGSMRVSANTCMTWFCTTVAQLAPAALS